jgi:PAS domain S-box-containing protein
MVSKSENLTKEPHESKGTLDALLENEERFSKVFNASPAAVSISRVADGLLIDVNEAYLKLFGFTHQEVIGHTSSELGIFTSPNERGELIQLLQEKGEVRNEERTFLTKKGKIIQTLISIEKISLSRESYIVSTVIDITERKKIEEQLAFSLQESQQREFEISALLKASRAVLQYKDFQNSARAIFDACKELIGATAGYVALLSMNGKENEVLFLDAGGLPCTVDPSLPMPIRGLRAQAYTTGKVAVENNFEKSEFMKFMPQGHVQLKNVLFAPLTIEHKVVGVMGLANKPAGFTDRDNQMALAFGEIASLALANSKTLEMLEKSEKELKAHSEHLEVLVEERAKQLRDSERLATIGATAGMVGHDIRNPLQAISSDVYLLKSDLASVPDGENKESMKESLEGIEENVEYVNKIVQDLQDFARPINPVLREVDVRKVLCEDALFRNGIPENISATCRVDKQSRKLITDPDLLKRILCNLVNNAIQAMPDGGKLDAYAYQEAGDTVFVVQDTGAGIPEAIRSKLFTPLVTTKAKGQGFGLAVVKRMTDALGGTITYESEVGKGTKFVVRLGPKK